MKDFSRRRLLAVSLLLCVSVGCEDYVLSLKHGFILARVSSDTFVVVDPDNRVVAGPTVTAYDVVGDVVTGRVAANGAESYFVIDMKTRAADSKLNEAQWRRILADRHIYRIALRKPTRFISAP